MNIYVLCNNLMQYSPFCGCHISLNARSAEFVWASMGGSRQLCCQISQKIWIERRCQGDEVVPDGTMKGGSVLVTWVTCSEK